MHRYLLAFMVCFGWVLLQGAPTRNYDSLFFLHAAQNHMAGEGMRNLSGYDWINPDMYFSDAPYTLWAPGYAWLLARGLEAGLSWQVWGMFINGVSLGVLAICVLWLLDHAHVPRWIQVIAFLLLLSNGAVINASTFLLSDMVFVCLTFLAVVTIEFYLSLHCSVRSPA